jgi:hypothetical protein
LALHCGALLQESRVQGLPITLANYSTKKSSDYSGDTNLAQASAKKAYPALASIRISNGVRLHLPIERLALYLAAYRG